jgi:beta-lactamase class A
LIARACTIAALCIVLLGAASPAPSPAVTPSVALAQSRVDTMLRTGHADPAWFSQSFLDQIPASKVDEVIASLIKQLGAYQSVELTPDKFVAHFAKGTDDVLIHLDVDAKIDGLLFRPPAVTSGSLDDTLRAFREQTGTLSYVITVESRSERAALNPSASLAVGSAFKLAVMNALRDQIALRRRRWNEVVPLEDRWKSAPSGVLQKWPAGTPITIATYAAEMISISDNTAADALASIAGRNAIRPYAFDNDPFLTTREMFVLHADPDADLRSAYLAATTASARAAIAQRAGARALPSVAQLADAPLLAIEWHYSVRQLCTLMERVADMPAMSINPGVADPAEFRHVAYKGGSDTGVLNMTTMVTTRRGTRICFSATINDAKHDIANLGFETSYSAVLRQLAPL